LGKNPNIRKFFTKFDGIFNNFLKQFDELSIIQILQSNIDEVYSELIPIDLINEFKVHATDLVPIENEDLTKNYISWRYFVDNEEKSNLLQKFTGKTLNFQQKYRPEMCMLTEGRERIKKKRLDIIIMASLIDKAPNLGGLARTCEVFNIGAMTVSSETILSDTAFITAASSAEKWLPLTVLPECDIEKYVLTYKKLGYSIIGLEQTANSIPLGNFEFKEKSLIILGNEKSGIPQNLIKMIDNCVIIPQFGNIRSLNVHVSAALMIWTIVNCLFKHKF
jgi:tRNA G18 (ribose-2'-O)-methylase SpoU